MPKHDPNDFTRTTVTTLAQRAGHTCSNPYCRASTSGPHSDPDKAVNLGEAAHIRDARSGTLRYNPNMTSAERSSIVNGIWLCSVCHTLIDRDDKHYTVDLLYEWKRQHEKAMELNLTKTGWERYIKERDIRQFEDESAAAYQIVLDKPLAWEFMLTVELLRVKLVDIKRTFSDIRRGLVYKPSRSIDKHQFMIWFGEKMSDLMALAKVISVALEDLVKAWGAPGEAGNELEIKRAVEIIISAAEGFINWEIDVYFTYPPKEFDALRNKLMGWTEDLIIELERIPKEISTIIEVPEPSGHFSIDLVFRSPSNIDEVLAEIEKLKRGFHLI